MVFNATLTRVSPSERTLCTCVANKFMGTMLLVVGAGSQITVFAGVAAQLPLTGA